MEPRKKEIEQVAARSAKNDPAIGEKVGDGGEGFIFSSSEGPDRIFFSNFLCVADQETSLVTTSYNILL